MAHDTQSGAPQTDWRAWAPVRMALLAVGLIAVDIGFQLLPALYTPREPGALRDTAALAGALTLSAAMIFAYRLGVRLLERRGAEELGRRGAVAQLLCGMAVGAGLFVATYAILAGLGYVTLGRWAGASGLAHASAVAVASAVGEEIVFRGVLFRIVEQSAGSIAAIVVSAALFGLLHAGNHGATLVSTIAIALEAGVLLGLAFAATRSLWLPIGVHFAWNFTEAGVFGAAMSGGRYTGLVRTSLAGPRLMTGGDFGPEASLVAVGVCGLASLVLGVIVVRAGRWRPAGFRLRLA